MTRRTFAGFAGGLFATPLLALGSTPLDDDGPAAKEILGRVAKTYAKAKSYRDSGLAKVDFRGKVNFTTEKPFKTAFVRPDRFRFEYETKQLGMPVTRYIISREGKEVRTWWDVTPGVKTPPTLGQALGAAAGVSNLTSLLIPALLLPDEVQGGRITELTDARRAEDAKIDDVDCYRVEGKYGQFPTTVWVDKASHLIRRVDASKGLGDFVTLETTTFEPILDGDVDDALLKFDPPAKPKKGP